MRFGARGHAMEVEVVFSTSMACLRAAKRTKNADTQWSMFFACPLSAMLSAVLLSAFCTKPIETLRVVAKIFHALKLDKTRHQSSLQLYKNENKLFIHAEKSWTSLWATFNRYTPNSVYYSELTALSPFQFPFSVFFPNLQFQRFTQPHITI